LLFDYARVAERRGEERGHTHGFPDKRLQKVVPHPDDAGTRVRRSLQALEDIYNPRPAPLIVNSKNELYDTIAKTIGDVPLAYLEFGVFQGWSIKTIAEKFRHPEARFFGFDSFEGLPEKWDPNNDVGQFSTNGVVPTVSDDRIRLIRGWFQDTVPNFLSSHKFNSPIFIHFDADLYSSTLFLLTTLSSHLDEYYFLFDEFFPDEVNALREFALSYPIEIAFEAVILNEAARPLQLFGCMRRVPFTLHDS
jgi:methyltransferase family protein